MKTKIPNLYLDHIYVDSKNKCHIEYFCIDEVSLPILSCGFVDKNFTSHYIFTNNISLIHNLKNNKNPENFRKEIMLDIYESLPLNQRDSFSEKYSELSNFCFCKICFKILKYKYGN